MARDIALDLREEAVAAADDDLSAGADSCDENSQPQTDDAGRDNAPPIAEAATTTEDSLTKEGAGQSPGTSVSADLGAEAMARGSTTTAEDVSTPQQSMQPAQSSPKAGAEGEPPRIYVFAGRGRRGVDSPSLAYRACNKPEPWWNAEDEGIERVLGVTRWSSRLNTWVVDLTGKQRNYGLISGTINSCELKVKCIRESITTLSMRVHPRYVITRMTAWSNRFPSEIQMRKRPREGNAAAGKKPREGNEAAGNKVARQHESGTIRHKGVERKQGEITKAIPPCSSVIKTAVHNRGSDQECSSMDDQANDD
ncbi:unnamed protein product [Phytophthora fragariaefolia]|uniref:Unnamed protein product n=1 Tax=Phytophthora fragariaefolia TaxID=1490495 RepID=A0A9W6X4M8_9STRA|nr:unnamed protein product [Phytophthora fragariaefolia]